MPAYQNSPGHRTRALQPGVVEYLLGSWAADVQLTRMLVQQVALASDVATLTVQVVAGDIPAVGSTVTVTGTSSGAGEFNVTRTPLTAVAIDASSGAGTVAFALTGTNLSPTVDHGLAMVDTPEVPETLADGSSVPAAPQQDSLVAQRTLGALVLFPTLPTAATVDLQWAMRDVDSEYQKLGTVATVASSVVTMGTVQFPAPSAGFFRFHVSGVSGSGTIVAKLLM